MLWLLETKQIAFTKGSSDSQWIGDQHVDCTCQIENPPNFKFASSQSHCSASSGCCCLKQRLWLMSQFLMNERNSELAEQSAWQRKNPCEKGEHNFSSSYLVRTSLFIFAKSVLDSRRPLVLLESLCRSKRIGSVGQCFWLPNWNWTSRSSCSCCWHYSWDVRSNIVDRKHHLLCCSHQVIQDRGTLPNNLPILKNKHAFVNFVFFTPTQTVYMTHWLITLRLLEEGVKAWVRTWKSSPGSLDWITEL